jgi:hypothetical protein
LINIKYLGRIIAYFFIGNIRHEVSVMHSAFRVADESKLSASMKPFRRTDAGLSLTTLTVGCDEYLSIRELLASPGFSQSVVAIWQLMGIIWVGLFRIGHLGVPV